MFLEDVSTEYQGIYPCELWEHHKSTQLQAEHFHFLRSSTLVDWVRTQPKRDPIRSSKDLNKNYTNTRFYHHINELSIIWVQQQLGIYILNVSLEKIWRRWWSHRHCLISIVLTQLCVRLLNKLLLIRFK